MGWPKLQHCQFISWLRKFWITSFLVSSPAICSVELSNESWNKKFKYTELWKLVLKSKKKKLKYAKALEVIQKLFSKIYCCKIKNNLLKNAFFGIQLFSFFYFSRLLFKNLCHFLRFLPFWLNSICNIKKPFFIVLLLLLELFIFFFFVFSHNLPFLFILINSWWLCWWACSGIKI